jgi:TPP-dependent pyruvate/acetoin dehydrogenase alpha subunit
MKNIEKWEDISEILERYISENYISKRELEEEEIEHQQEIRWAIEEERKKIYTENGANSMCDYWYKKGKEEERERIIEEIEKMRTAPPENANTEVKDTFQTINNTISSIVMRIKNLNNPTSQ